MTDEKRKLVDEYWDHMRTRNRAWVRMMNASHRLVGNHGPGRVEELGRESTLASDEMTTAEHAADLVKHAINEIDRSVPHTTHMMFDPAVTAALLAAAKEGR
jgi:hypothetical protein